MISKKKERKNETFDSSMSSSKLLSCGWRDWIIDAYFWEMMMDEDDSIRWRQQRKTSGRNESERRGSVGLDWWGLPSSASGLRCSCGSRPLYADIQLWRRSERQRTGCLSIMTQMWMRMMSYEPVRMLSELIWTPYCRSVSAKSFPCSTDAVFVVSRTQFCYRLFLSSLFAKKAYR